jgi:hypothetical protein
LCRYPPIVAHPNRSFHFQQPFPSIRVVETHVVCDLLVHDETQPQMHRTYKHIIPNMHSNMNNIPDVRYCRRGRYPVDTTHTVVHIRVYSQD